MKCVVSFSAGRCACKRHVAEHWDVMLGCLNMCKAVACIKMNRPELARKAVGGLLLDRVPDTVQNLSSTLVKLDLSNNDLDVCLFTGCSLFVVEEESV